MGSETLQGRAVQHSDESMFAAAFAHEINNPLTALLNLLYLIKADDSLSKTSRQYLTLAEAEAHRISEITHATMNELRGTVGRQKTNVPKLLRHVLAFYKSRLDSRGISVKARYCPECDLRVYPSALRQTFSNLLLNASDAMRRGGKLHARVSIAKEWAGQKRHGLRVTFADNGCGIREEDLPRILEPFFTTKGSAGTGIGLSLVRETVQKHGGALRVRSSTKRGRSGSIFSIFLPAT
jgi:two-component system CheB/CheR fusion protein